MELFSLFYSAIKGAKCLVIDASEPETHINTAIHFTSNTAFPCFNDTNDQAAYGYHFLFHMLYVVGYEHVGLQRVDNRGA